MHIHGLNKLLQAANVGRQQHSRQMGQSLLLVLIVDIYIPQATQALHGLHKAQELEITINQ